MEIAWLPEPEQHPLWPEILALIAKGAELGGAEPYSKGELVWIAFEQGTIFAVMTTALNADVAEIRNVAGTRLRDWLPEWARIFEQWARNCGADWLECRGRKGWGRFAERFGWHFSHVDKDGLPVFEKELV